MCSPTCTNHHFTRVREGSKFSCSLARRPLRSTQALDKLGVQLEKLRAAKGGRFLGCKKLAAWACGISQQEAKELLQLKLEQDLEKELASATKCALLLARLLMRSSPWRTPRLRRRRLAYMSQANRDSFDLLLIAWSACSHQGCCEGCRATRPRPQLIDAWARRGRGQLDQL